MPGIMAILQIWLLGIVLEANANIYDEQQVDSEIAI
jgi:hypothetical protein